MRNGVKTGSLRLALAALLLLAGPAVAQQLVGGPLFLNGTAPCTTTADQACLYYNAGDHKVYIFRDGVTIDQIAPLSTGLAPPAVIAGSLPANTTYYIAPSALTSCRYDGDGSATTCAPSDSNDGLSKAAPFATADKLAATINGKVMLGLVTVKFARTTGGSCYQPSNVVLSPIPNGLGTVLFSLDTNYGPPPYPTSMLYLIGDTTTPSNVKLVGAASCAGTTLANTAGFIFKGTNARVRGFEGDYYGGNESLGVFTAVQSQIFAEDLRGTTDVGGSFNSAIVAGTDHSKVYPGGTNWGAISNYIIVSLSTHSDWYNFSALGQPTFSWSTSNGGAAFYIENESEAAVFDIVGTFTITGGGVLVYVSGGAFHANVGGTISGGNGYLLLGDFGSLVNITATGAGLTFNAPDADLIGIFGGSQIRLHCNGHCTFTSPIAHRATVIDGLASYDDTCNAHGVAPDLFFGPGSVNCLDALGNYTTESPTVPKYVTFGGISQPANAVGPLVPIATYAPPPGMVPVHGGISGIVVTPGTCTACGVDDHTFRLTDGTHNHDCESGARGTVSPILCTAPAGTKIYCPTQADPNWSANSLISLQAISNTGTCTTPPIFQLTADLIVK